MWCQNTIPCHWLGSEHDMWQGRKVQLSSQQVAHLLEKAFGVNELGMTLHGGHALDESDAGRVQRANHKPCQASGERCGTFPVLAGDAVPMSDVCNSVDEILRHKVQYTWKQEGGEGSQAENLPRLRTTLDPLRTG